MQAARRPRGWRAQFEIRYTMPCRPLVAFGAHTVKFGLSCDAGRSSPSRLARTAEEAGLGQPAGAEAWVTRTGAALCSKAPPKAQPRPRRPRVTGKEQAPSKRVRMQCNSSRPLKA